MNKQNILEHEKLNDYNDFSKKIANFETKMKDFIKNMEYVKDDVSLAQTAIFKGDTNIVDTAVRRFNGDLGESYKHLKDGIVLAKQLLPLETSFKSLELAMFLTEIDKHMRKINEIALFQDRNEFLEVSVKSSELSNRINDLLKTTDNLNNITSSLSSKNSRMHENLEVTSEQEIKFEQGMSL